MIDWGSRGRNGNLPYLGLESVEEEGTSSLEQLTVIFVLIMTAFSSHGICHVTFNVM